jgi:MFS family permease
MRRNRTIIYIASFILAIPVALTSYINSSFLLNFMAESSVSLLFVIASLLAILCMANLPKVLSRMGNRRVAHFLCLLTLLSFATMALSGTMSVVAIAFIINWIAITLLYESLDIFMEDFSRGKSVGAFRGFYLALTNLAWILAQFVSSRIIIESSFSGIYLISAILMLLVYMVFKFSLSNFKDPKYENASFVKGIKFFVRHKNFGRIYLISFILRFFYAWMVIYTPLYLHDYLMFDWAQIGIIFSIMIIPFLLEFPLGKLSDKIGEKKMLKLGFLIAAAATLAIPMIKVNTLAIWATVLFATRVGAAMIEVMADNYFFKSIEEENVEALSFFRNVSPLSYVIGPIMAIPLLAILPSFVYLFYVLGAVLLIGFLISFKLKEVR